jgi:hypothetical protein
MNKMFVPEISKENKKTPIDSVSKRKNERTIKTKENV